MSLDERLAAVERALTDDAAVEPAALSDAAAVERRLVDVEAHHEELETRLADLEAAVDSLRAVAGEETQDLRAVEQTAERALATARETAARLDTETPPREELSVVREPHDAPGLIDRLRAKW